MTHPDTTREPATADTFTPGAFTLCETTGKVAVAGACVEHGGDNCLRQHIPAERTAQLERERDHYRDQLEHIHQRPHIPDGGEHQDDTDARIDARIDERLGERLGPTST